MNPTSHRPDSGESFDSPDQVLAGLRQRAAAVQDLEIDKLHLAVAWAIQHPVESINDAATVPGTEGELSIAGVGAPLVAEFCVAEYALALGLSSDAGRRSLGEALELRYRLTKLWTAVITGKVPVWRARKIAQATMSLPVLGAAYVDRHLAPVAGHCSWAQLDRTVAYARDLFDPEEAATRRRAKLDGRHFDIDTDQVTFDGTMRIDAELDLADALDLEDAIARVAAQLADLGSTDSLDVRRSIAAGEIARHQHVLDLDPTAPAIASSGGSSKSPVVVREVRIIVHTTPEDLTDLTGQSGTGFVVKPAANVSIDQIRDWCTTAGTRVVVRPVIDLNENLSTSSYQPTDLQREQAVLVNPICVFPYCNKPAARCDLDHIDEWTPDPPGSGRGGETESSNLAPLCRGHHRLKTHGGWTYVRTGPTTFTWTSPHGYTQDWDTNHAQLPLHPPAEPPERHIA